MKKYTQYKVGDLVESRYHSYLGLGIIVARVKSKKYRIYFYEVHWQNLTGFDSTFSLWNNCRNLLLVSK